ncbi:MAG: radical SAM protein [Nitrososphaerales archaeon]
MMKSVPKDVKRFQSLQIWDTLKPELPWYFAVSTNNMPAKYLISKRITTDLDIKHATEDELWLEHDQLIQIFLQMWRSIKTAQVKLADLPKANNTSLMDINVELVKRMLTHCNFCRWNCKVDRAKATKYGACKLESTSRVSTYFHHLGEELPIRGTVGSGTIFFTSCNMRCSFCQNGDISQDKDNGIPMTPQLLALMAWQLRMEGCHNINWVGGEPTIHLHNIVEAISLIDSFQKPDRTNLRYIESANSDYFEKWSMNSEYAFYNGEFNAPQLWNSNFFMSLETLKILRTLIDVWLPDFKFGPGKCAINISRTPWYWETITNNLKVVHEWGDDIVIRHLIMPAHVECCTKPVLQWIEQNMPEVPVNIMDQYHPDSFCDPMSAKYDSRYQEISRLPTNEEILESYRYAKELHLNFELLSYEKSVHGLSV